jgi:hypothetical protein
MIRDPGFEQSLFKQVSDLDTQSARSVRRSMKAELLNIARENPDGGMKFLTDPRNKRVIENVFGSGYQSTVRDLVKLSDAVNRADVGKLSSIVTQRDLDAVGQLAGKMGYPGLDLPYVTSTLRDRISSVPQKVVRILTRVQTAKTREETDEAIFDLLMNPQGLKALQKVGKEFNFKIDNPLAMKKITENIANTAPMYAYGALKASVVPPQDATTESSMPVMDFAQ